MLDDTEKHYAIVARAIEYIRASANRQPELCEIAAAVNLSEFHLQRVFTQWAGVSPKRFLQYVTKQHARQALRESADILSATLSTGLSSPSRLHDLMIACEAMTPGEIKARGAGVKIGYGSGATPFGPALLGWTPRGICYFEFHDGEVESKQHALQLQWPASVLERDDAHADRIIAQIFPSLPLPGKLHLMLRGTNFQIKVWEALLNIAPAQRVSYSQLAAMIGAPNAQRAVGTALSANTIGYLIPCHRVIRETGETGHYRWGSNRKAAMLAWEASRKSTAATSALLDEHTDVNMRR
ncbi:MAG: methylated-DNA--[protein]-cysteine S-methyltransferase [Gammaproteobacteria bacterium]|nr:methylated-DNA--[protein]-cysteine S-methyltransferase [Gammaproteobacteria bacterium]